MISRPVPSIAIVIGVLIVIALVLPRLVNVDRLRPKLESELTGAIGRQVRVDSPRLSMISVSAHNISIADDPAFSTEPFVTAQFPFALAAALPGGGTTADPKFVPNVKAIAGNAAKQAITGKVAEGRAERKVARRQN